jgi:hypothetical protein
MFDHQPTTDSSLSTPLAPIKSEAEVFESLKSLVGSWEGKTDNGRVLKVTYTLHAKDSVLMEAWVLGPTSDALTLYHMDADVLMATHYCPLCNQPRLLLSSAQPPETFVFEFCSATNLPNLSMAHQHRFEVSLLGPSSFWRSETYVTGDTTESEGVTYYRI